MLGTKTLEPVVDLRDIMPHYIVPSEKQRPQYVDLTVQALPPPPSRHQANKQRLENVMNLVNGFQEAMNNEFRLYRKTKKQRNSKRNPFYDKPEEKHTTGNEVLAYMFDVLKEEIKQVHL